VLHAHAHVAVELSVLAIRLGLFFINPAVSEANMVDSCKHFEIGSGSVRSLSHLSVFVIEHLFYS
jgi:hypothetical protein